MGNIEVNGHDMHVVQLNPGADQAIIMVHGLFANLSVYYFVIAPYLARKYHVVLYDLRGHGMSPRSDDGYSLDVLSADLLALMDVLGIRRTHLVGYSYGGAVALYTALNHSGVVHRLALIEAVALDEPDLLYLAHSDADAAAEFVRYKAQNGISGTYGIASKRLEALRQQVEGFYRNDLLPQSISQYVGYFDKADLEALHLEAAPLLVYGASSPHLPTGQKLSSRLPGSKLLVRPGDHDVVVTQARWIAHQLKRYFS